jgi:hypothetical protein
VSPLLIKLGFLNHLLFFNLQFFINKAKKCL